MGFDYQCDFKLKDCINALGIEERGRVQTVVTDEVLRLSDDYVPFDEAGKYENPGRLKDSVHIEDGTDVVWNAPYARRWLISRERRCAAGTGFPVCSRTAALQR